MPANVTETGQYTNLSASALVRTGSCQLLGVFCASSSSGTLKLWDQTSAAAPICVNTFNLIGGTFYPIGATLVNGLYATIANTADVTIIWTV